jgi:hypothetical protein
MKEVDGKNKCVVYNLKTEALDGFDLDVGELFHCELDEKSEGGEGGKVVTANNTSMILCPRS